MSFDVHEYYDWTQLIKDKERERLVNDITLGIKAGKFWHNSPKYQTNWNVFATPSQDWVNLKMSFIWSCFAFLNKEVSIKQIQSWHFKLVCPGEDRDKLWHHHNHNTATETVSGVYYLHLPDDVTSYETAGTELAPNGVEGEGKFITEWKTGHWMIYPGKIWHRPGILQSTKNLYIVAADMEF